MWKRATCFSWILFACTYVAGEINSNLDYDRSPGKPLGMMPYCPGVTLPAMIEDDYLFQYYSVVVQKGWKKKSGIYRKRYFYRGAPDAIASDPNVDFKRRKTMIVMSEAPLGTSVDADYQISKLFSRIGYNTISVATKPFTHAKYAVTARLAKAVGNVTAILIRDLMKRGLNPSDIVMVGGSLGAHMAGFAGKYLYQMTGKKIGHIMAIDPSGLCFRHADPQDRLSPSDADFVQATHFNMFGYGMEAPVGHVDFYINGGLYQGSWYAVFPCLSLCSHVKAFQVFYYTIKYPGNFRGTKCKDVHQAVVSQCFNNSPEITNTIGLFIDKNTTGIFYVPTFHLKPYFSLNYRRDVLNDLIDRLNDNENIVIDVDTKFGYDYATDIPTDLQRGYDKLKKFDYSTEDPGLLAN